MSKRIRRFNRISMSGLVALWVGGSVVIGVLNHDAAASLIVGGLLSVGAALGGVAAASAGATPNGRPSAAERRVIWRLLVVTGICLVIGALCAIIGLSPVVPLILAFGAALAAAVFTLGTVVA